MLPRLSVVVSACHQRSLARVLVAQGQDSAAIPLLRQVLAAYPDEPGLRRLVPRDGRLGIVWRSDRYIDVEREFGRLLDQLVAARRST